MKPILTGMVELVVAGFAAMPMPGTTSKESEG
jgi:hypothetical protein